MPIKPRPLLLILEAVLRFNSNQHGFSIIEALLAVSLFGSIVAAMIGALVYGQTSTADADDRSRALQVVDEGLEAVREIRGSSIANLTDGTYGLVQTGGVWTLSGSSDITGIYSRQIVIATSGTNRKFVTSRVYWANGAVISSAESTSELTNWVGVIAQSLLVSSLDLSGTVDAIKVATQGNYAYYIRNDNTPDFQIVDISTPASPVMVGSLSLAGTPTNIAVSGNYAYVSNTSDTAELQIVNIATPTAPALTASFNATGTADGQGVAISGSTVYLARAANLLSAEFTIVNVATPASPAQLGAYANNISMREIYVNGTTAYVVTDTGRLLVINVATSSSPSLTLNYALPGSGAALTITGTSSTGIVGRGSVLYTMNLATPSSPVVQGTLTLPGTINDLSINPSTSLVYAGTSYTAGEYQIVSITSLTAPAISKAFDITGTSSTLNGVSYSTTKAVVAGASSSDTQEAVILKAN